MFVICLLVGCCSKRASNSSHRHKIFRLIENRTVVSLKRHNIPITTMNYLRNMKSVCYCCCCEMKFIWKCRKSLSSAEMRETLMSFFAKRKHLAKNTHSHMRSPVPINTMAFIQEFISLLKILFEKLQPKKRRPISLSLFLPLALSLSRWVLGITVVF